MVYLLVDKDYKNALYSLGSSVSFGAGKLVAWAGKGSKTALRIQKVCNFVGSGINFAQSAEGTVNMGGMMIDKYIIQGQLVSGTTAMEFLFLGANIFGATKSGTAIATDVRDFGKFAKMAGIPSLKGDNRGVANAKALIDAFKSGGGNQATSSNEVYYRTMSQNDYDYLRMTGELPATGETFISSTKSFSSDYDGVMVSFELNKGTTSKLEQIGLSNGDRAMLAREIYPNMSYVSGVKWTEDFAFFKAEGAQINIGLGKGKALEIFNSNISTFKKVGY